MKSLRKTWNSLAAAEGLAKEVVNQAAASRSSRPHIESDQLVRMDAEVLLLLSSMETLPNLRAFIRLLYSSLLGNSKKQGKETL